MRCFAHMASIFHFLRRKCSGRWMPSLLPIDSRRCRWNKLPSCGWMMWLNSQDHVMMSWHILLCLYVFVFNENTSRVCCPSGVAGEINFHLVVELCDQMPRNIHEYTLCLIFYFFCLFFRKTLALIETKQTIPCHNGLNILETELNFNWNWHLYTQSQKKCTSIFPCQHG